MAGRQGEPGVGGLESPRLDTQATNRLDAKAAAPTVPDSQRGSKIFTLIDSRHDQLGRTVANEVTDGDAD
jgi:hypothetical protein